MVAEDVPSYKIVNGEVAEPLLTRIVNRETGEQRWRLVKAAPLRGPAGELMAVSVIEDVDRGQGGRAAPALPRAGRRDARLLAGLRGDAAARRAARGAGPRRLVRGRRRRRRRSPPAGGHRARRSRQDRLRARVPQSLPARSERRQRHLRRAALRAPGALSRDPPRAARAEHQGPRAAAVDRRAGHALGHAHPDGRRRAHDRRPDDGVGREWARVRRGRPRVRGRPRAPRRDRGRERAPVHRARPGRAHAAGEPAARAPADHRRVAAGVLLRGRRHDRRGGRRLLRRRRARGGLPGGDRRRHRQGRAGRGADRARPLHAGHGRALRSRAPRRSSACSTTSSSIAPRSPCSPSRARTSSRAPRARACT